MATSPAVPPSRLDTPAAAHASTVRLEGVEPGRSYGFFTDTTVCIGCKACEVACKQWNGLPDDGFTFTATSYDNTGQLGASTWRHVAFVEQPAAAGSGAPPPVYADLDWFGDEADAPPTGRHAPEVVGTAAAPPATDGMRWLMMSDVCKHCTSAGCLDVCPTGAIIRTEFDTVYVQPDVCNGCGMCVVACPFGVVDRDERDGRAFKCTLCYDRLRGGMEPACAKACPTDSIVFGELDELRDLAADRVATLHDRGETAAYLYGADPDTQPGTGGLNAFFLLTDRPEVYNLPPAPEDPTLAIGASWRSALVTGLGMVAAAVGAVASLAGARR